MSAKCRRRHSRFAPRSNARSPHCFRTLRVFLLSIPFIPKGIPFLEQIAPYSNIYSAMLLTNTVGAPIFQTLTTPTESATLRHAAD